MASALEYHVYAKFPCNNIGVRVAVTLSERTAQKVGGAMSEFADEVWYKIKARASSTKPHRASRMWRRKR